MSTTAVRGQVVPYDAFDYTLSPDAGNVLRLEPISGQAPAVGDRALVLEGGELRGAGEIVVADSGKVLVELDWLDLELPAQGQALVIPRDLPLRMRDQLPPWIAWTQEAPRAGASQPPPGANPPTATQPGSQPTSAPASQPATQTGASGFAQVPQPMRVRVVAVELEGDRQALTLTPLGLGAIGIGDRFDLYRGWRYVGFARAVSIGPSSARAETLASLSATPAQPGDLGVRRPPAESPEPRRGYVFRREGEYVLVSLGEADGIRRADRLHARAVDGGRYELIVDRAYPDHCGATVEATGASDAVSPSAWDPVCPTQTPRLTVTLPEGAWLATESSWLVRLRRERLPPRIRPGDFVLLGNRPGRIGVLLVAGQGDALAYFPGVWAYAGDR